LVAGAVAQERRTPGACVVAGAGALDLDHVGAQVGEVLRAPRPGEDTREVEDAQAAERTVLRARSGLGRGGHENVLAGWAGELTAPLNSIAWPARYPRARCASA